ncbi:hypothetical protein CsSME_00035289 [Camellia sinensis var. sinensis]|uniref:uncharacterized protein LOC114271180 n=1 Tax=Camellia sinensis TaxID=4442 RepID=UPI001036E1BF|nr:uncharacterized protein LOC114271180 [Camellia sinensis]
MARPLLLPHHLSTTSQSSYVAATLLLCAFALFACASHSRKWRRQWRACYGYGNCNNGPVIQHNNEEMICGFQFCNGGEEGSMCGRSGEVSVWKKNILMGGKCQLPDFSGVIIYDSAGNIVPAAKASPALPWK